MFRLGKIAKGGTRVCGVLLTCAGVALTRGIASPSATSPPAFAAATSYATGYAPVSVAIGDLNGDGKPDLATANLDANTVSVFLNRGDGSFRAKLDYRAGGDPRSVAIRDLSSDRKPDLVTANADANTVSVFLNRGGGSFQRRRDHATGPGPLSVAIGDLNGDGKPDVATANRTQTASVLLNRGSSFRPHRDYRTRPEPVSIAIGDLNGEGKPDLVTANATADTVSVLLNRGDGRFRLQAHYATGRHPMSVAIGDLNGDRKPDLAAANLDANTVSVLINRGDRSFRAKRDYTAGGDPRLLAIGDLNGDGRPDLVAVNADAKTVSVLVNRGDGSFRPALAYGIGRRAVAVAVGDLNGDGKPDLATADLDANSISVHLAATAAPCIAPDVAGSTLPDATKAIGDAGCRVGQIGSAHSNTVESGHVISEQPRPGTILPNVGEIDLVISEGSQAGGPPAGLLLWNKLGSAYEVTHSAFGPNLSFFDCRDLSTPYFGGRCGTDVPGKLAYPEGVFGGAAAIGGGPYFSAARVHAAMLRASILNPEHGAVEAWYRQDKEPVPFEHDEYRIFGGPYSLVGIDEVNLYGSGGRLHFALFFGEEPPPFVPPHLVAVRSLADGIEGYRISGPNGRWIHVAGVWDRRGIAGTRDALRLYVNGTVVAAAKAQDWGTTPCGRRVAARPAGACFIDVAGCNDACANAFAVDNLKVWSYAKTDYSDRFAEGF